MNKEEFLKNLAQILSNNVGSKLTNELASGLHGNISQMLNQLKLDKLTTDEDKLENGYGESKTS